jgi:hypothetical protein
MTIRQAVYAEAGAEIVHWPPKCCLGDDVAFEPRACGLVVVKEETMRSMTPGRDSDEPILGQELGHSSQVARVDQHIQFSAMRELVETLGVSQQAVGNVRAAECVEEDGESGGHGPLAGADRALDPRPSYRDVGAGRHTSPPRPGPSTSTAILLLALLALACGEGHDAASAPTPVAPSVPAETSGSSAGLWIGREELARQPVDGPAWRRLESAARSKCGIPRLDDQNDQANVCVMAKALVATRTDNPALRAEVIEALRALVQSGGYTGRALALGRELIAYVIAADVIDLRMHDPTLDNAFRDRIASLVTTPTTDGPRNLVDCHERRPNNWGTHCGASRAAVAAYLDDQADLNRVALVFRGYLGDRASYAGFQFGDLSWQCDPDRPVGINPVDCVKNGHPIDGVMPDDQRRSGGFKWPPPPERYVYGALQGALAQAVILQRAGYDAFNWEHQALRRAFEWLHTHADYPAEGDDTWQPHVVNRFYGTTFPAPIPARPGKNVGWSDWTHGQ